MSKSVFIIALAIFTTSAWAAKKPCARLLVSDDFTELVNEQARAVAEYAGEFKLKSDLRVELKGDPLKIEAWILELKAMITKIRADYYVSAEAATTGLAELKERLAELGPDIEAGMQLSASKPIAASSTEAKRFMKREALNALPETEGMSGPEVEDYLRQKEFSLPVATHLGSSQFGSREWPPRMKP